MLTSLPESELWWGTSCIGAKLHNKDSIEKEFGNNFYIRVSVNFRLYPEKSRKTNAAAQFNNEQENEA